MGNTGHKSRILVGRHANPRRWLMTATGAAVFSLEEHPTIAAFSAILGSYTSIPDFREGLTGLQLGRSSLCQTPTITPLGLQSL
jgi:hypothetical protein